MEIEHAATVSNHLGEGPVWHQAEQRLYWVDATSNSFLILDPSTGKIERHDVGRFAISIAFCDDGELLIATDSELAYWSPGSNTAEHIATGPFDSSAVRFNDGKVDPAGRYFVGTMHRVENKPLGGLYRLTAHGDFSQVEWNIITSNGLGWSPDGLKFYYTDSIRKAIYCYDYDQGSGIIANRAILVDSQDADGVPDGLTVDAEGCIWSARFSGWNVTRYDPNGKKMVEMRMPVAKPTSCTFGGPDLQDLYVTTARYGLDEAHLKKYPESGDLFVCHAGIKGQVEHLFVRAKSPLPRWSR
jgi:sugar lactone lactonase YvrE